MQILFQKRKSSKLKKRTLMQNSDLMMGKFLSQKRPARIADQGVTITADIIDCDLPLLLSKEAMKTARAKLDFVNDKINILGKDID